MNENSNDSLMESTGLGLLPGIMVALTIAVLAMAALLFDAMWAVFAVLALIVCIVAAIVVVVLALAGEDEDHGRLRRRIPGLGPMGR